MGNRVVVIGEHDRGIRKPRRGLISPTVGVGRPSVAVNSLLEGCRCGVGAAGEMKRRRDSYNRSKQVSSEEDAITI